MKTILGILSAVLVLSGITTIPAEESGTPLAGHPSEPTGILDVSARVASRSDTGLTERVVVELEILSDVLMPSVRISGRVDSGTASEPFPDRVAFLQQRAIRKIRYTFDLERGREHHLNFSVRSEDPLAPSTHRTSAYVRVNLDPEREPEDLGHLLQFRAKMAGEVAP